MKKCVAEKLIKLEQEVLMQLKSLGQRKRLLYLSHEKQRIHEDFLSQIYMLKSMIKSTNEDELLGEVEKLEKLVRVERKFV